MIHYVIHYVWINPDSVEIRRFVAMRYLLKFRAVAIMAAFCAALAACARPQVAQGLNDPYEARNRAIHESSKRSDTRYLRPLSQAYGKGVPAPVREGVNNFAGNIDLPRSIVNDILQANIDDAAHNLTRFLINTTFGIGGIFDPATSAGLDARASDFGETLHVWGVTEGHYVEMPFFGPSTKRDAFGRIVDLFLNPVGYILPAPQRYAAPVSGFALKIDDRYRFTETVDSILYDSADSYAQARLLYLQNRRFQLGQEAPEEEVDPYAIDTEGF
ncbi:MAG: VacJ family lipoprotein [Rhodobacter sp.]|nr:VacJ family lipoprotein [Rhodobacter sp.]